MKILEGSWFSALCLVLLVLGGCPKAMRYRPLKKLTSETISAQLAAENARRLQVSGIFLGRGSGIRRFLGSLELDVVAQAPSSIYISMRSFFSQPARVFASDGLRMYLLEMTDLENPRYITHALNEDDIEEILPLPLSPREVVEVVLGRAPIEAAEIVDLHFEENSDHYVIKLLQPSSFIAELTLRSSDNVILRRTLCDRDGRLIYSVQYRDFRYVSGIDFAHRWEFEVGLKGKSYGVSLIASDIALNGELFGTDTFRIEAP